MENEETSPHYLGHRERLKKKIFEVGAEALADYELLEMVLVCAIPRKDVKPLAKELINAFGSFSDVINAEKSDLLQIKGIGEGVISFFEIVKQAALRLVRTEAFKNPVLDSFKKLVDYCVAKMGRDKIESFRVIFLDTKLRLIADELFSKGTVDQTLLFPREVLKRVISLGASSIIMVHNHPSGDTKPSKADVLMTKEVMQALSPVGVELVDHLVVSKNGYTSFKSKGLI